jgi:hypothetical protein|tara:strand:+ start:72 stop:455 length:384 start_codon:yes stop_codon:yes gene_type:complete
MKKNEKEVTEEEFQDLTEEEQEEEYGKMPKSVLNAFDNTEDVLKHITDDGLDELNHEMEKCRILNLGIELNFTNRNNIPFKVIVCPDMLTDDDNMRRKLYESGKSIEKNFPHIAGNEVSRYKGERNG